MRKQAPVDCKEAIKNQSLPTSAEMMMQPWDQMKEIRSIPARIAFLNQLYDEVCTNNTGIPGPGTLVRVAVATTWSGNLWGVRRGVLPFLQWHTQLGICKYYIAYHGSEAATMKALSKLKAVELVLYDGPDAVPELAEEWQEHDRRHEWTGRPGNWELMRRQGFTCLLAIRFAKAAGFNWIMHIDADELLVPGTTLQADLLAVPKWAGGLLMFNHEGMVESVDIVNKYEQVTLFKKSGYTMHSKEAGNLGWDLRHGEHGGHFKLYVNGKSVGRVDTGPIKPWGPHEFISDADPAWKDPVHNPDGRFRTLNSKSLSLVHVPYTHWSELVGKAKRSCPMEYQQAVFAKNLTKVKECFCLDFDLQAYVASTQGKEEAKNFWILNSLFSEGTVRKDGDGCRVFRNVTWFKQTLVRHGVFMRYSAVQQTLRAHELGIRAIARNMGLRRAMANQMVLQLPDMESTDKEVQVQ